MADPERHDTEAEETRRSAGTAGVVPADELDRSTNADNDFSDSGPGTISAGGGTDTGGLAGSNIGNGAPDNAINGMEPDHGLAVTDPGPVPPSAKGGGITSSPDVAPGTTHRGDSTIGSNPPSGGA